MQTKFIILFKQFPIHYLSIIYELPSRYRPSRETCPFKNKAPIYNTAAENLMV